MTKRSNHCKRGHEFTPENTIRTRKQPICIECMRQRGQMKTSMILDVGSPATILAYIEARSVSQDNGCRDWVGARDGHGYGNIRKGNRNYRAHRLLMTGIVGRELDVAECVLHRCDNPLCVNPDHLFIGTHGDNSMDMAAKGRAAGSKQKLTYQQTLEIKAALVRMTIELAAKYGVSRQVIDDIQHGRTRRHVPPPCLCTRLHFPHKFTDACQQLADEQRESAREIAEQHASELAAERRAVIKEWRL